MIRALIVACLLLAVASAFGQGRSIPEYQMAILRFPAVQQELKLTPSQKAKAIAALDVALREYKKLGAGAIRSATVQHLQGLQLKALEPLTEAQKKRLREISLQIIGPYALNSDRIAQKVGLTPSQRAQLSAALLKMTQEARINAERRGPGQTASPGAATRDMLRRQRAQLYAKAESMMTPVQKKRWRALNGKPFDLSRLKA
jgi:hypothetical protein